jgi:hypothetical protein
VGISVLGVAIDDLIQWEKLTRIDYIKIDVQGAESKVLSGAKKCINIYRPIIQTEIEFKKVEVALPRYKTFQARESPNLISIPQENESALSVVKKLDWKEQSYR